ncbi:MAG: HAD-IC family P-type ATPase [Candidatus Lokiarchaeota archaeon]|nr:HAD-IC family P-type ATPase [Candidatus Lokiarchaeota archaeon]MBD3339704.1 HAD-IC family P-type ATPase [Candidatus Lokiarchaeota archaeon]
MSQVSNYEVPEKPWTSEIDTISKSLQVDPEEGINTNDVKPRRRKFGPNRLKSIEKKSIWAIIVNQVKSVLVLLLIAAVVVSFVFGRTLDAIAILAVVIINVAIGFFTEWRAARSMEALYELTKVETNVKRDGKIENIPARKVVVGDILFLRPGDIITADARLTKANKVKVDESSLTGESVPVNKHLGTQKEDTPLAERSNMIFKGTALTRGEAEAIVVATGQDTQLGKISSLVEEAKEEELTPLEKRLQSMGQKLLWITLIVAVVVAVIGILRGRDLFLMIETALALAVAAVPEGLPIVVTIALARGMWLMAKNNALVNQLSAVEVLGSTSVICTDKTGTMTENKMTVTKYIFEGDTIEITGTGLDLEGKFLIEDKEINPQDNPVLKEALTVGALCNNASIEKGDQDQNKRFFGEPMEVAILISARKAGLQQKKLQEQYPEEKEFSFDPEVKMMATYNKIDGKYLVSVKGAPEAVLDASSEIMKSKDNAKLEKDDVQRWLEINDEMASNGLRVLALAKKEVDDIETEPYENLTFIGLICLLDPPRKEVTPSILKCKEAGIKIVMVTGDQAATAANIAAQVGIVEDGEESINVIKGNDLKELEALSEEEKEEIRKAQIFARVSPEQKLNLIDVHQEKGSVVAMTGDGVNDAPALEKSDIGVAMGERGTQVAKEAADIVLKDDNFETITYAVSEGRTIFINVRKFAIYLLSCNIAEILVILMASIMNIPLPILPLQILYLNIVTDVFPALALSACRGDENIMNRPPRDPNESILTKKHFAEIIAYGSLITFSVLSSFLISFLILNFDETKVVTISFLTLAFAQLWHVFNMRKKGTHFFKNEITQNKYVWLALLLSIGLLIIAVYLPFLSTLLETTEPGLDGWAMIIFMSLSPFAIGQIWNSLSYSIDFEHLSEKVFSSES